MAFRRSVDNVVVNDLSWLAPTLNSDGTPIDYPLGYNLYIDGVVNSALPATLNPAGRFEFPLDGVSALAASGTYQLTVTAFNTDDPFAESAESNPVSIISFGIPESPTDLLSA